MSEIVMVKPVRLHWAKKRCTGCMSCVIVCSERHTGMSAPSRSRIEILVDPLGGDLAARYCRQCKNAPCAEACPETAIQYDKAIRAWLVDAEVCTGCGLCIEACPFEVIRLDPVTNKAIKCDLCMGALWCVEVCPAKALTVRGCKQKRQNGE